jgi:hypothetical protein
MRSPRAFSLILLSVALGILAAIALLNYWIDPYNQYANNSLGVYAYAERQAKPNYIRQAKFDSIIVGNSRVGLGFLPEKISSLRLFNGGLGGASLEEIYYFIKHNVKSQKLLILGIDLCHHDPEIAKQDDFEPPNRVQFLKSLLNLKQTEDAFRTLRQYSKGRRPSIGKDGGFYASDLFESHKENPEARDKLIRQACAYYKSFKESPTKENLSYFLKISLLMQERKINCVAVVLPLHQSIAQNPEVLKNQSVFSQWKDEMRSIFPNFIDLSFSKYCTPDTFFRSDPVHINPVAGSEMFNIEIAPTCEHLIQSEPAR